MNQQKIDILLAIRENSAPTAPVSGLDLTHLLAPKYGEGNIWHESCLSDLQRTHFIKGDSNNHYLDRRYTITMDGLEALEQVEQDAQNREAERKEWEDRFRLISEATDRLNAGLEREREERAAAEQENKHEAIKAALVTAIIAEAIKYLSPLLF